jgi:hypothetical protein
MMQLSDARLEAAVLRTRIADLKEELALLKRVAPAADETPVGIKWGCYQLEGEQGLYCTGCWDTKRRKALTNRVDSMSRRCGACQALIGS